MASKRCTQKKSLTLLRQIEVGIANGKPTPQVCNEAPITVQTYSRWRKEYGGLKLEQAKRMKELERENTRLKRLVAELSLEKHVASGNFWVPSGELLFVSKTVCCPSARSEKIGRAISHMFG